MSSRYRQLADELRAGIADGTYPPGSRLPSESELALRHGASRGTIRQAFALLAADGLISSRKGARRLVTQAAPVQSFSQLHSFSQWAASIGETPGGRVVSLVRRGPTELEAERLGLDPGARVYHLTRLRLLSGRPVMIERTAYVERVGALVGGIDADNESITLRLEELGVVFAHAEHTVSAVPADAEDARLLGVRPRTPLLRELRRTTDLENRPLEWSDDRYLGDAVAFTVHNSVRANTLIRSSVKEPPA
ncbi:GntR family transcriptional regulator [Streptosporangium carneum]|uniref:GntR family transcriptional regulator n=1 Tax=Streptosporangium carneum TaxID=47481 RepID=A0A9W6MG31_9ACTN|nr:GntR family transcriptional regulator [Streptosporangium carneum]GLK12493.1 GntR family transcriptional regulator [Streptosporangium carneum]